MVLVFWDGFFRYGCGGLLAISASEIRWIFGYLHFDDVISFPF